MSNPSPASDSPVKRVFVAEFLCGGGMLDTPVDEISSSLLSEGELMWRSLVEDFSKWAKVRTPVDPRLSLDCEDTQQIENVRMQACDTPWEQWILAARDCDACLLIIPESDGLLATGIAMMRAAGIEVLAPAETAIRVAADKWATAKWLHQAGIAHPDTWSLQPPRCGASERSYAGSRWPTVGQDHPVFGPLPGLGYLVKPRDGCGAMNILHYDEFELALAAMNPSEIVQRRLSGRSASVIVISNHTTGRPIMLPAVWQSIDELPRCQSDSGTAVDASSTGDLVYRGGYGPVPADMQARAHAIVDRVVQAMPGKLSGFLGIDLILGDDAIHDAVIEINPRVTTSYVGLRQMTNENLTQRLFGTEAHLPVICVPSESVYWNIS